MPVACLRHSLQRRVRLLQVNALPLLLLCRMLQPFALVISSRFCGSYELCRFAAEHSVNYLSRLLRLLLCYIGVRKSQVILGKRLRCKQTVGRRTHCKCAGVPSSENKTLLQWRICSDVMKTFFKTKTKIKTLHLKTKTKTKTFLWCLLQADWKAFLMFGRKRKCRRKWNSIYGRKRNENFQPKNGNESHLIILVFFLFIHSVTKSALQCAGLEPHALRMTWRWACTLPRTAPAFLQVVFVDRIPVPLSSCTVYRYLCGIFLDDISTREQFAFLVYCYRVKEIFHTVLY